MMLKQAQEEIHPHYRRRKAGGEEKRQRGERVTEREREAECLDSYSYVILHLFWLDFNFSFSSFDNVKNTRTVQHVGDPSIQPLLTT